MSQKYFDESGDVGNLEDGSNTEHFTIAVYEEISKNQTTELRERLKKLFKVRSNSTLKWQKLSIKDKLKFERFYEQYLVDCVYIIYWDKSGLSIKGRDTYSDILTELIKRFGLSGNFKFEGEHLYKSLDKIRRKLRVNGKKMYFKNVRTEDNFGIQICDLVAGLIRSKLLKGEKVNFANIIKCSSN